MHLIQLRIGVNAQKNPGKIGENLQKITQDASQENKSHL